MKYGEFTILSNHLDNAADVIAQMQELPKPKWICGKKCPDDLNGITIGQLLELQMTPVDRVVSEAVRIIMDATDKEIADEAAEVIIGFGNFVASEMKRIASVFATCKIEPTPEQVRAGFNDLNFGPFGLIDAFARRMGITDHTEVEKVPWVRIYKCMDMDAQVERCRRRMAEQQRQSINNRRR